MLPCTVPAQNFPSTGMLEFMIARSKKSNLCVFAVLKYPQFCYKLAGVNSPLGILYGLGVLFTSVAKL